MFGKVKRFVVGKKGMEALQAVLLLGAAFFIIAAIKQLTPHVMNSASNQLSSNFSSEQGGAGGAGGGATAGQ